MSKHDLTAPADPSLAPGEARCPGPSMQDILDADGDNPPAAMREQALLCQHWLDQVLLLDNDAFEVDALAMAQELFALNEGSTDKSPQ